MWHRPAFVQASYDVYRSDADLFQWARRRRHDETVSSHIVVAFRERSRTVIKDPKSFGGEESAILHYVEDGLRALMPFVVIREVVWQMSGSIQHLREEVFSLVGDSTTLPSRIMRNPTAINAELLRQSILLARLKSELGHQSRWFDHKMNAWKEFFEWLPKLGGRDLRLPEHTSEWITYELGVLDVHLDLARSAFAEYFPARNTRAIYWLTIAALVLAVVQPLCRLATTLRLRAFGFWAMLESVRSAWFQ